mmetsp:Transcript_37490/g.88225  ORF Transcript_37490/g.88225 Transcript_37490/m.88225 type:complete len:222 (-) Transcript_37490:149-814(-)
MCRAEGVSLSHAAMMCSAEHPPKPTWKILGARKQTREAMRRSPPCSWGSQGSSTNTLCSSTHSVGSEQEEVHAEVLDRRLAWKVLAHRRTHRLSIARCDFDASKNLGCCHTIETTDTATSSSGNSSSSSSLDKSETPRLSLPPSSTKRFSPKTMPAAPAPVAAEEDLTGTEEDFDDSSEEEEDVQVGFEEEVQEPDDVSFRLTLDEPLLRGPASSLSLLVH